MSAYAIGNTVLTRVYSLRSVLSCAHQPYQCY